MMHKSAKESILYLEENPSEARDILNKHGIDINDATNGVYLPTKNNASTNGVIHNGRHPKSYNEKINDLLDRANKRGGKKEVLKELNNIKNKLSNAPPNSNWRSVLW